MKRYIILGLDLILVTSLLLFSCKKQPAPQEPEMGQIEINFSISNLKSAAISNSDTVTASTLASVIISIEDLNGKVIKNSEKIDLYNMNGSYISKPLSLTKGNYKLTRFLVLDWQNNVVYSSPLKGSAKAYLVNNPLPLTFTIQTNSVTKVSPEVLNAAGCNPEDFGYTSFSFNIAQTFDFLVGTFIYNDTIKNYKLTSSSISIYTDTVPMYSGQLTANSTSALVSIYDSLGITNKITLPERFNKYTLAISKPGYKTFNQTYTKEELKLHLRSKDKGPLVVILLKEPTIPIPLPNDLVAFYKFNGDVLDYSGYNNNGTCYGSGVYDSGYKAETNGAINLNGSSDYLIIKNSTSLNPINQITVCAWYYSVPFYGNGSNSIVCKSSFVNGNLKYQYQLSVTGSLYSSNTSAFGFVAAQTDAALHQPSNNGINTTGLGGNFDYKYFTYELYKWYFVAGTYDGQSMKLYVNGDLKAWRTKTDTFEINSNDIYIGNMQGYNRPDYDFTAGRIDEVRIYNRALNDTEILNLYQQ